ncbi:fimbrial assembly protein [Roseateles sp.]|uniref:type IV pilus modification PilV family protein n=1 Tax=Roseateles sp. TaxID=1971397 RepID=UPI00286CA892|nr:fimbrial assembly protein [Roseateles sp.]
MKQRLHRQKGIALIEVLAATLLISFGLLGLVSLQAKAVQYSVSAEDSQRAAVLASDLAAEMWGANTAAVGAGVVAAWAGRVADPATSGLPNGLGTVTMLTPNRARIQISWRPPNLPTGSTNRYITDVEIGP